jgi:hypothetical protein
MSDREKQGNAGLAAFAALATLASRLNRALNRGQTIEMETNAVGGTDQSEPDDGFTFRLTVKPLAPGEKPGYPPCGVV